MAVDTSVIGKPTGAWRVVARPGGARELRQVGRRLEPRRTSTRTRRVRRVCRVPAPPTFTFAAPYWAAYRADEQPGRPDRRRRQPDAHDHGRAATRKGALVLHGEQEFDVPPQPVAGDVLDGVQTITDIYEKDTDSARHDLRRHGDGVDRRGEPARAGRHRALQPDRPPEEIAARIGARGTAAGQGRDHHRCRPGHRPRVRRAVPRRGRQGRRRRDQRGARRPAR